MGRPRKEKPNHTSGMYEVKITVGKTFDGKLVRKSFYSAISKADAKAKAEEYKVNRAVQELTGENPSPTVMTFERWAKQWLETYKKGSVKQHTYLFTYESNVVKYLIPFFGKAKIADIKQIDIQRYFNTVKAENGSPLAKSTLDKQKMILKSIFDAAIDNDLCYKNPVKGIKYQAAAEADERHVFTAKQADAAKEYALANGHYDIYVMLATGIRRSELLGLQWADIDLDGKTIHIRRSVVQTKGEIVVGTPKTETSDRLIPFSAEVSEVLKAIPNHGIYVFGTDAPQSPSTFSAHFAKKMKAMHEEIGTPILTPHELRHTYGTLLREAGVDIYTIQKVMGHSDISVTAGVYVHNDIEVLRQQLGLE